MLKTSGYTDVCPGNLIGGGGGGGICWLSFVFLCNSKGKMVIDITAR